MFVIKVFCYGEEFDDLGEGFATKEEAEKYLEEYLKSADYDEDDGEEEDFEICWEEG